MHPAYSQARHDRDVFWLKIRLPFLSALFITCEPVNAGEAERRKIGHGGRG